MSSSISGSDNFTTSMPFVKAYVTFNGSDGSILGSYNVTSVTKTSSSDYTINFTNALPNANYAVSGISSNLLSGASTAATSVFVDKTYKTTTTCRFRVKNSSDAFITSDRDSYDFIFFG